MKRSHEEVLLQRRTLLKAGGAVFATTLLSSTTLLSACSSERQQASAASGAFTSDDAMLLEDIADTLLPTTPASPGAKAAGVAPILALLVNDCNDTAARARLTQGLVALRERCAQRCGGGFTVLAPAARETLLVELDTEARAAGDAHWFHLARELSLRAYFSSEIGMTRALRYVRVPGRWTGCVPLEPGQPAWG